MRKRTIEDIKRELTQLRRDVCNGPTVGGGARVVSHSHMVTLTHIFETFVLETELRFQALEARIKELEER